MSCKKIIFAISFLTIFGFLFSFNIPAAKAMTAGEIQTLIQQLLSQIAQLQKQLAEIQGVPAAWCHGFNTNLRYGDSGPEVEALLIALEKEGLYSKKDSSSDFNEQVASAVTGFQERYRGEILTPLGLKYGTGFVGKSTRGMLNNLYGCGVAPQTPISTTPIPATATSTTKFPVTPKITPEIIPSPTFSITIISPGEGEKWTTGSLQKISWKSAGLPSEHLINIIRLRDSAGVEYNLLANTLNDGFQEVSVPAGLSSGNYVLEMKTIIGDSTVAAKSAPFNIFNPSGASLRVLSPNGGEQWTIGNTYTIKWDNLASIPGIYVELYKGGVYLSGLGGLGFNFGAPTSWTWNTIDTPNFEAGSDFKIRIKSDTDKTIYDESDNYFSIAAPTPSPTTCSDLKANSATNYFYGLCTKGGYDRICFNKYYSTYQGCGKSFEYDGCTVSNMNADKNIYCNTGLVYTCSDSDSGKSSYNQGTVTDSGKTYTDYCQDSSTLKEYFCTSSDSFPSGIVGEENYTCPSGCENGACKSVTKTPITIKNIEVQLASVSQAVSQLIETVKKLLGI